MPSTEIDEPIHQFFRQAMVSCKAFRVCIQGGNVARKVLKLLFEVVFGLSRVGCVWCKDMVVAQRAEVLLMQRDLIHHILCVCTGRHLVYNIYDILRGYSRR